MFATIYKAAGITAQRLTPSEESFVIVAELVGATRNIGIAQRATGYITGRASAYSFGASIENISGHTERNKRAAQAISFTARERVFLTTEKLSAHTFLIIQGQSEFPTVDIIAVKAEAAA